MTLQYATRQARQGDLLFIKTNQKPHGQLKNTLDIIRGKEGNTHRLTKGEVWDNGNDRPNFFLVIPESGAQVIHTPGNPSARTHKKVGLSSGTWTVIRQREVTGYVED